MGAHYAASHRNSGTYRERGLQRSSILRRRAGSGQPGSRLAFSDIKEGIGRSSWPCCCQSTTCRQLPPGLRNRNHSEHLSGDALLARHLPRNPLHKGGHSACLSTRFASIPSYHPHACAGSNTTPNGSYRLLAHSISEKTDG